MLHVLTRKFPGLLALPDAGLEVHHLSAGLLVVSFVVVREHANLGGALHGAMFAWLVDELTTIALMSSSSRPRPGVSVHLSVEYAGSAPLGTRVYVEAKAEKVGRALAFSSVRVFSARGALLATASHTKYLNSGANPILGKFTTPDAKL